MAKQKRKSFLLFLEFVFFLGGLFILVLIFSSGVSSISVNRAARSLSYPPPEENASTKGLDIVYPPPNTPYAKSTVKPTNIPIIQPTNQKTIEPGIATELAKKQMHTPSQTEISLRATEFFDKKQPYVPPPQKTQSSIIVQSDSDLPAVVYNDPFLSKSGYDFSSCINTAPPGEAVFVKALGKQEDYYLLPFFSNKRLCGIAMINVLNGRGYARGWSEARGDKFPAASADDAIYQLKLKTGVSAIGKPRLVFGRYYEAFDYFSPFWEIEGDDGQGYFVILSVSVDEEDNKLETSFKVIPIKEMHPIE